MFTLCLCIKVTLGLSVWLLSQVGIKEVSQEALHPGGLGAHSSRDQRWIQRQVQDLCGAVRSRPSLGGVETLDGAGQPDESLETLDVSAAVVHQLVFGHSSATLVLLTLGGCKVDKKHDSEPLHRPVGNLHLIDRPCW